MGVKRTCHLGCPPSQRRTAGGCVGGVVVHDQMNLEIVRASALDHTQELVIAHELPAAIIAPRRPLHRHPLRRPQHEDLPVPLLRSL